MSDNNDTPIKPGKPTAAASAAPKGTSIVRLASINGILKDERQTSRKVVPTGQRMTAKQEAFARHVASGLTLAASYRLAYDASGMSPEALYVAASNLASNSKVAVLIDSLKPKLDAVTLHDPSQVKAEIVATLRAILSDTTAKQADRMKAAELLGRWGEVGLFNDISTLKVEHATPEEQVQALTAKLRKLAEG